MTGAEILGKTLKTAGVEKVFGLVGHGNIGLLDGIVRERIDFIACHHETIAGMAADGYFRSTGKPGVICLTCAPGALNAQLSIATAAQDHSALIYIVGDIPLKFAGKGTYEEVDLNGPDDQFHILKPNFKRAWKVSNLELLSQYVANAFTVASTGCPGPVLLNIPFDLDTRECEAEVVDVSRRVPRGRPQGEDALIVRAVELLIDAKHPVLFIGGGINLSGASFEVLQLSDQLGIPIVSSIMGAGCLPGEHPNFAGFIGSYGTDLANKLVRNADLVLAIGTRFEEEETAIWMDGEVFRIPPAKLIQLDIDPATIGKNYPVEIGIVGDAAVTLQKLMELATRKTKGQPVGKERLRAVAEEKEKWLSQLMPAMTSDTKPINPRRILHELKKKMSDDTILTVDPSWARIGLLQQLEMPGPNRCYIVGGVLPIGWSTAAALGVALGRSPSTVVAITGDGGFFLNIQSLLTAAIYDLPITWIIINNGGYNALDVLQKVYFGERTVGSRFENAATKEVLTPDFAAIARGMHVEGENIDDPSKIEDAIERALGSGQPHVLNFITNPEESRLIRTAPVTWSYFWGAQRTKGTSPMVG